MVRLILIFRKLAAKVFKAFFHRYPYIYRLEALNNLYKFQINSPVEDFRIKEWGGEREYTLDIIDSLAEGDVFYDVGSSIGLVSVLAAKKIKKGTVVAFEPEEKIVDRLNKNISLNSLTNVKVLRIALGDKNDTALLYSEGADTFSPRLSTNESDSVHEVPVRILDSLLLKKEVLYPTVVKIDVEGAEMKVLSGMKELLGSSRRPKKIFLEIHPGFLADSGSSAQEVMDFVLQYNYKAVYAEKVHEQLLCKFILD